MSSSSGDYVHKKDRMLKSGSRDTHIKSVFSHSKSYIDLSEASNQTTVINQVLEMSSTQS